MKRSALAGAVLTAGTMLGVLAPMAGSTAAWAGGGPQHVKHTFTGEESFPAGTVCDFDYHNVFTGTDNVVVFPGRAIDHIELQITHMNLDTGFTLAETDHFTEFTAANGQIKDVGIFWHLRNAAGKIVVVHAGQLVISATGEVLKFTPNVNPDFGAVICPALGGQPAS